MDNPKCNVVYNYSVMKLTPNQRLWLHTRGGRRFEDIIIINDIACVLMLVTDHKNKIFYKEMFPIPIPGDKECKRAVKGFKMHRSKKKDYRDKYYKVY